MASRLQDVLLRGLAIDRPLATAVANGTLYYSTDTAVTEQSDGSAWNDYSDAGSAGGITELTGDVTAGPGSGSQAATIGNLKVITATIDNLAVTTGKINNLAVTTAKIAALAVTNAEIAANAVITVKVLDDNITYAKIQNVSATDRLLGRDTAAAGDIEEIPVSAGLEFTGGPGLRVTAAVRTQVRGFTTDGGATVLTSGIKGYISFPVACTIIGWRMLANAAGAVACELKKADYATFPTMTSITAAAPPNIPATNQKAEDNVLTGWTTAIAAGDVVEVSITGTPAVITRLNFFLMVVLS